MKLTSFSPGSYKRISSSASLPPITARKIQSQLARRVVQEAIMFGERVGSRTVLVAGGERRECPVRPVRSLVELSGNGIEREREAGLSLVAVLDLTEPAADSEDVTVSTFLPSSSSAASVPVYQLAHFFHNALLPPNTSSLASDEVHTPPSNLITSLRAPLDDLIALFAKRAARLLPAPIIPNEGDEHTVSPSTPSIYAIFSSTTPREPTAAQDVVPLLIALWRCRLWNGEGWTEDGHKEH